jgi:hypothetical protein
VSFQERQTWVAAVVTILVPGWYFISALSEAASTPVADIQYQWPLVLNAIALVAVIVAGIIATTILSLIGSRVAAAIERGSAEGIEVDDSDLDRSDERDAAINRFGGYVGGIVLGIAVLVPLGLAMWEVETFWIANALYAALVLSLLASSVTKLVAYRRGF